VNWNFVSNILVPQPYSVSPKQLKGLADLYAGPSPPQQLQHGVGLAISPCGCCKFEQKTSSQVVEFISLSLSGLADPMEGEASVCWAIIAPHEHIMD
jgi:hypothetical protein